MSVCLNIEKKSVWVGVFVIIFNMHVFFYDKSKKTKKKN
jgi:hypothetical protein